MIRVWDVEQGLERRSWRIEPTRSIAALAIDSKNRHLLCGCGDGSVSLWDFESGKIVDAAEVGIAISAVAISDTDAPRLAIGSTNGVVFFWEGSMKESPLQLVSDLQPLKGSVRSLGFNAAGDTILAAGKGGVNLFECEHGTVVKTIGESWITYGAVFTKDLDRFAMYGPPIRLIDLANGPSIAKAIDIPSTEMVAASYVASEDALIVATADQCLRRISLGNGRQETLAYLHSGAILN